MKIKNLWTIALITLISTVSVIGLQAHDDGHKSPRTLPPIGPHGGKYTKLSGHYGEVVVKGNQVKVYILEKDVKYVAEDAKRVSVLLEVPGKSKTKLKLTKSGKGYSARINIPRNARRVYFHIKCMLDKKWERGKVLYEPRR